MWYSLNHCNPPGEGNKLKKQMRLQIMVLLIGLLECGALSGCSSNTVLSDTGGDASICMEVSDYTGNVERTITIKNTQSGYFSVEISPSVGNIEVTVTDGDDDVILSMNEKATLSGSPSITEIKSGNGTYHIAIKLKKYTGSFEIMWNIKD